MLAEVPLTRNLRSVTAQETVARWSLVASSS